MKTTRLKAEYLGHIKTDPVLCGIVCRTLGKSAGTVLYRMVPNDDVRLTLPMVQKAITAHLQLPPGTPLIEEVNTHGPTL